MKTVWFFLKGISFSPTYKQDKRSLLWKGLCLLIPYRIRWDIRLTRWVSGHVTQRRQHGCRCGLTSVEYGRLMRHDNVSFYCSDSIGIHVSRQRYGVNLGGNIGGCCGSVLTDNLFLTRCGVRGGFDVQLLEGSTRIMVSTILELGRGGRSIHTFVLHGGHWNIAFFSIILQDWGWLSGAVRSCHCLISESRTLHKRLL